MMELCSSMAWCQLTVEFRQVYYSPERHPWCVDESMDVRANADNRGQGTI